MAVGQAALRGTLDVPALNTAETRLEVAGTARCHAHAQVLRQVLEVHRVHLQGDLALATVPQVALLLQLSESAAHDRLSEALLLLSLPGGIEALECGLLNPEQSTALLRALGELALPVRLSVWRRVQARLLAAQDDGTPLPAHELSRLLSRWIIAADPAEAQDRRRAAEDAGDVSYRRRGDGLGDLFATAVPAPLLHAVLARVRDAARPWGSADERTVGKRRLDALLNLILGRDTLPFGGDQTDRPDDPAGTSDGSSDGSPAGRRCGSRCGCRLDAPAPCGADVVVHVPLGAALGTTDELGELIGHGPLDPQQLAQILLASPRLRAVHVDAHGIPVSVADHVTVPPRDDPAALRAALLALATTPPGPAQPQHPHDHQPPAPSGGAARPPADPPDHRPDDPPGVLSGASASPAPHRRSTEASSSPPDEPSTSSPRDAAPPHVAVPRRPTLLPRPATPTRPVRPARTARRAGSAGSSHCAHPGASGPAAAPARSSATSSTTGRGRPDRPAPATPDRCAATTTASSNSPC